MMFAVTSEFRPTVVNFEVWSCVVTASCFQLRLLAEVESFLKAVGVFINRFDVCNAQSSIGQAVISPGDQ